MRFWVLTLIFSAGCVSTQRLPEKGQIAFDTILFKPSRETYAHPQVVVFLHGSGGPSPYSKQEAKNLADRGFHVLHYCWFNCENPSSLIEPIDGIDLQKVKDQILSQLEQQGLSHTKFSLAGVSRGAELVALLLTKKVFDDSLINAAILISGSERVQPGRDPIERDDLYARVRDPLKRKRGTWSRRNAWSIGNERIATGTQMDLSQFSNPVLLVHGEIDNLWPAQNSKSLFKQVEHNRKSKLVLLENEDHIFSPSARQLANAAMVEFLSTNSSPAPDSHM